MATPGLVMASAARTDRLSDAETVQIGRLLVRFVQVHCVSYADDSPTVVVISRDHDLSLAPAIRARREEFLGSNFSEEFVRDLAHLRVDMPVIQDIPMSDSSRPDHRHKFN